MARIATAVLALLAVAGCGDEGQPPPPPSPPAQAATSTQPPRPQGMRVQTVATDLEVPWDVAFLPDGSALVTERPGRIRLVDADGRLQDEPVAEVETEAAGEGGLLGLALDPEFEDHPFAYVYVTRADGMEVERLRWDGERLESDGIVLDGIEAGPVHDSGRLRFGPDDDLYLATGEAGQPDLAQDPDSLNGKFLRIPLPEARTRSDDPEIVSSGHRNPQGLDWEPGTGRLVATEHGPSGGDGPQGFDEVNVVEDGRNYGWPEVYGDDHGDFAAPLLVYEEAIAPSGAAFVTEPGSAWTGDYVFAALRGEQLRRLRIQGDQVVDDEPLLQGEYGRLRAVVEASDGSLWVTTSNRDGRGQVRDGDDKLLRVVPPG